MDDRTIGSSVDEDVQPELHWCLPVLFHGIPWLQVCPCVSHPTGNIALQQEKQILQLAVYANRAGRPLKMLDLKDCDSGTDSVLQQIRGLHVLRMVGCPEITIKGLLAQTQLRRLYMELPNRKHPNDEDNDHGFPTAVSLAELAYYIAATPSLRSVAFAEATRGQIEELASQVRLLLCGPPGVAGCVRGSGSGDVRIRVHTPRESASLLRPCAAIFAEIARTLDPRAYHGFPCLLIDRY